jgi:hypothetical protein
LTILRGIDNEYGKYIGVYSSSYSILKEDNRLTFLTNLINSELIMKIYELGKVRNSIVHNPWVVESEQLKDFTDQLLMCTKNLIDLLQKIWICRHCKSVKILDDGEKTAVDEEITCTTCEGKSVVISVDPLISDPIPSNSELALKYFKDAKWHYSRFKQSRLPDLAIKLAIKDYEKAKEYGCKYARREIGLLYFRGEGYSKNDDEAFAEWNTGGELGDTTCWGLIAAYIKGNDEKSKELWEKYFNGDIDKEFAIDLATAYIIYLAENNENVLYKAKLLPLRNDIYNQIDELGFDDSLHEAALNLLMSLEL